MVYEIIQIPESFSNQKKSLNAKEFKLLTVHNPLSPPPPPPPVQALVSRKETHVKPSKFWVGGSMILTQCPDFNPCCWKVQLKNSQLLFFSPCPMTSSIPLSTSGGEKVEVFSSAEFHSAEHPFVEFCERKAQWSPGRGGRGTSKITF